MSEYEDLLAKITHPKKRLFLEHYPKFNVSKYTADAIDVNEATIWRWLDGDETFKQAMQALKKDLALARIEIHEKNIHDIALDPKTPPQTRVFGSLVVLRAESPDKYREKPVKYELTGDINFNIKAPEPDYKITTEETKLLKEGDGTK